jgi:hypothetical protein
VEFLSFSFVFVILDLPKRVAFLIESGPEFLHGFLFVFMVDEESLEVKETELGFGESVKRVDFGFEDI